MEARVRGSLFRDRQGINCSHKKENRQGKGADLLSHGDDEIEEKELWGSGQMMMDSIGI